MSFIGSMIEPSMKPFEDELAKISERRGEIRNVADMYVSERNKAMDRSDAATVKFYNDLLKEVSRQLYFLSEKEIDVTNRYGGFYRSERSYYTPHDVYSKSKPRYRYY